MPYRQIIEFSKNFTTLLENYDIEHIPDRPYYPQSSLSQVHQEPLKSSKK